MHTTCLYPLKNIALPFCLDVYAKFYILLVNNMKNLILTFIKKLICLLFGHKYRYSGRNGDEYWGSNLSTCKRCGKEIDSLFD